MHFDFACLFKVQLAYKIKMVLKVQLSKKDNKQVILTVSALCNGFAQRSPYPLLLWSPADEYHSTTAQPRPCSLLIGSWLCLSQPMRTGRLLCTFLGREEAQVSFMGGGWRSSMKIKDLQPLQTL